MTHLIAGAIKYSEYDFLKRALFHYFENPGGLKTAVASDTEYTNWSDLEDFVDEYLAATQSEGRISGLGRGDIANLQCPPSIQPTLPPGTRATSG